MNAILYIQEPWFTLVGQGRKTVEGRACHPERWVNHVGQVFAVRLSRSAPEQVLVRVTGVRHYPDLESYLTSEDWRKYAPHAGSLSGARKAYSEVMMWDRTKRKKVPVFSPERVASRGGMSAIEFELIR